jgi:beta-glucuronidase
MSSKDRNETGNFSENIHSSTYEREYLSNRVDCDDMLNINGRDTESLNGLWNFGIDQYDNCLRSRWYEEKYFDEDGRQYPVDYSLDRWERVKVPSCWNMHRERYFLYEGSAVYTRTFRYASKGEKRVFIRFGAVNYEAKVFLNKKYIGMHKGGSTPFYFEVTGMLREDNRLLVVANNTRKRTSVPCENTDWFNYGGIYRDVELIRIPETFIKDFQICLKPDGGFKTIKANVQIGGTVKDGNALLQIPELGIEMVIAVKAGAGEVEFEAAPMLWSPETPKLYTVHISFMEDALAEKVGFREIRVKGTEICLNGKKIFLKGICAHEESVTNGKAVTEDEIRENFRLAKEMNCNYMRLAHYPHTEKAAKLADEEGIMLWEEIPVYWAIEFENPETYKDAENQLTELIKRDRNRASVIIWSVGNENADTDARFRFMSSLAAKAKEMDPSRLVSAACLVNHVKLRIEDRLAGCLDIIGLNEYFGWYEPDFGKLAALFENSRPEKPVVITEFGADARYGERGTAEDHCTEDCQLSIFRKQVETIGKIPYVKGTSPWILFDFRCPRRLHYMQDYYNIKGLLTADKRHKKPAFFVMKEFYSRIEVDA